jgi:hypothetical protein
MNYDVERRSQEVLSMLEQTVGTEKFNQLLDDYQETRERNIIPGMADGEPQTDLGKDFQDRRIEK